MDEDPLYGELLEKVLEAYEGDFTDEDFTVEQDMRLLMGHFADRRDIDALGCERLEYLKWCSKNEYWNEDDDDLLFDAKKRGLETPGDLQDKPFNKHETTCRARYLYLKASYRHYQDQIHQDDDDDDDDEEEEENVVVHQDDDDDDEEEEENVVVHQDDDDDEEEENVVVHQDDDEEWEKWEEEVLIEAYDRVTADKPQNYRVTIRDWVKIYNLMLKSGVSYEIQHCKKMWNKRLKQRRNGRKKSKQQQPPGLTLGGNDGSTIVDHGSVGNHGISDTTVGVRGTGMALGVARSGQQQQQLGHHVGGSTFGNQGISYTSGGMAVDMGGGYSQQQQQQQLFGGVGGPTIGGNGLNQWNPGSVTTSFVDTNSQRFKEKRANIFEMLRGNAPPNKPHSVIWAEAGEMAYLFLQAQDNSTHEIESNRILGVNMGQAALHRQQMSNQMMRLLSHSIGQQQHGGGNPMMMQGGQMPQGHNQSASNEFASAGYDVSRHNGQGVLSPPPQQSRNRAATAFADPWSPTDSYLPNNQGGGTPSPWGPNGMNNGYDRR